ncbi:hypothetical protein PQE71_gp071 [Bacillus phage Izhevsk]|uniref:Uncharacterized protein n=1 Tax=Bacillus phage Izhevsk TaxID=2724322 RepID=A0A6H0X637_9CAUD|nr:hypothetical protein PQE71_gp071 [Bacillus phage Izhevsk]QIW89753.1 hypothetical protein Izhevsk_72 [Bacillus phage Izhevsk]UUV46843.1 hypothetical protein [Bacillus phage vB_BanS-Thrax4]
MTNETEKIDTLYVEVIENFTVVIELTRIYTSKVRNSTLGFTRYYNEYYDLKIYKTTKRKYWFGHKVETVFNVKWDTNHAKLSEMIKFGNQKVDSLLERMIS